MNIYFAVATLIFLNLCASFYIGMASEYKLKQKIMQIILIWLIPLISAIIFIIFLKQDRKGASIKRQVGNHPSPESENYPYID